MSSVIYRLIGDEVPWYMEVNNAIRDLPGWAKVAGIAGAPVAAAAFLAFGVEAAAVAGVVASATLVTGAVGLEGPSGLPPNIRELDAQQAGNYHDEKGGQLVPKISYLQHPKLPNTLIMAPNFRELIVREQSSQLMAYIRATVKVKRICIAISFGEGGAVGVKSKWFDAGKNVKLEGEVISDCTYDRPEQTTMPDDLYWMSHFPTVIEGLRQAASGTAVFKEHFERTAHLEAAIAKVIGLDSRATQDYRLNILVEFS